VISESSFRDADQKPLLAVTLRNSLFANKKVEEAM